MTRVVLSLELTGVMEMIKLTTVAIVLTFATTGVAYLYLPEPAEPTAIVEKRSPPPRPQPGTGRRASTEDPFGGSLPGLAIIAVVVMGLKTLSEANE